MHLLKWGYEVMHVIVEPVGLVNRTLVHPREKFSDPLKDRAARSRGICSRYCHLF